MMSILLSPEHLYASEKNNVSMTKIIISAAAKRKGCAVQTPCHINVKKESSSYWVSANKASISEEGILMYRPGGKTLYEYDFNGNYIGFIGGR